MHDILHLFDSSVGWEQRVAVSQLLNRLPRGRFTQTLAAVDYAPLATLRPLPAPVRAFPRIARLNLLTAPLIARYLDAHNCELIHAWGPDAAAAAAIATRRPLVVEVFDPALALRSAKLLRTLARPRGFGLISSCEIVRRRLIEGGVTPEVCVTIRPGIDFAFLTQAKQSPLREQLGIGRDDFAVLLPEPVLRDAGHLEGFWAGALMNHLSGKVKVVVPGCSPEQRRISRFAASVPSRPTLVAPGNRVPYERMIPVVDALVVATDADVATTAIAWAMASRVAVIAAAGRAVAELIANKVNGLLFKRLPNKSPTISLLRLLRDRAAQAKAKEAAHGQAYEVFGLRRYVEQHMMVYENVLSGAAPGRGVTDSARVG